MNHNLLKSFRIRSGKNQNDVAKEMNLAIATYCNKENGKVEFTTKEISQIKSVLKLSDGEISSVFPEVAKIFLTSDLPIL